MTRRFSNMIGIVSFGVGAITLAASLAQAEVRTRWAVVDRSGVVDQSSGGITVEKTDTGAYLVHFSGEEVKRCAFVATIGAPDEGSPSIGFIRVHFSLSRHAIFVITSDKKGEPADRPFHITAACGKT